jgi:uncharacterized protein YwqG
MEISLPTALEAKRAEFLATKASFIHIEPFEVQEPLPLWASKYRGLPYLPKNAEYPVAGDGRFLVFLAQINFAEMPRLEGYPETGLLQFFISDNDLYGLEFTETSAMDFNDPNVTAEYAVKQFQLQQQQNYFRIVYYPELLTDPTLLIEDFSFLPQEDQLWGTMPVSQQCRLEFSPQEGFVGLGDYQFNKIFGDDFFTEIPKEQFDELIEDDIVESYGNKIGGYASFSQTDVRELAPVQEKWLLLLQIDRAKNADIMWGDGGAGNFFIEENDLRNRDFSRVVYNWDCG